MVNDVSESVLMGKPRGILHFNHHIPIHIMFSSSLNAPLSELPTKLPVEILRLILQSCPNHFLYALVVGSSHTFELATPVLWSSLPNAEPLINLIPDAGSKDLNKVMPRWNHYAPFVQHINVGPTALTARQYRILLCAANRSAILPNLVRLAMRPQDWPCAYLEDPTYEARFERVKPYPANWTFAMHFVMLAIGPALRVLEIAYAGATIPNFNVIFMRAPRLSNISFIPTVQDYDYEVCNNCLYFNDEPSLERQKRLGYSNPGTLRVEGPPGTAEYNAIHIVQIPAPLKSLTQFTCLEKMSLHSGYFRGVNLINIGRLPSLRSLTIRAITSDSQPLTRWQEYSCYTEDELFPVLHHFSLLATGPSAAFWIFSVGFMLHRVHYLRWETSQNSTSQAAWDSYIEALKMLSGSALSLTSLDLILLPFADTPDQRMRVQTAITKLWPGSALQQVSGKQQIRVSKLRTVHPEGCKAG
ncbi:hypothetical protein RSAG8_08513, partial [Rhizoctonia solani AG-8 WAC10335]